MDIKIGNNQLKKAFASMMMEYRDLEHTGKSYDYWIKWKKCKGNSTCEKTYIG